MEENEQESSILDSQKSQSAGSKDEQGWKFDPKTGKPLGSGDASAPEADPSKDAAGSADSLKPDTAAAEAKDTAGTDAPESDAKTEETGTAAQAEVPKSESQTGEPLNAAESETAKPDTQAEPPAETAAVNADAKEEQPADTDVPKFDSQTGEPLGSADAGAPKADTETSQNAETTDADVPKFDSKTGEPLGNAAAGASNADAQAGQTDGSAYQKSWKFDPKTGERIDGGNQKNWKFDPKTGEPLNPKPEKKGVKKPVIIGAIAAAAVIVIVIIANAVMSNPTVKVAKACYNTVQETLEALTDYSALEDLNDEGSAAVNVSVPDSYVSFDMNLSWDGTEHSADGTVNYDDGYSSTSTNFDLYAGSEYVAGTADLLNSNVFYYNYTEENSGYLIDMLEESGISQEDLNQMLKDIFDGKDMKDKVDTRQLLSDLSDEMDIQKADSAKFTVNGKEVNCKGYSMEIDNEKLNTLWNIYYDAYDEAYDFSAMDSITEQSTGSSMKDPFSDLEAFDYELNFYVHGDTLAAIVVTDLDTEDVFTIGIEGGDFPLQNLSFNDGESTYRLVGETNDGVYTADFVEGEDETSTGMFSYSYDTESGEYTITADGESVDGTFLGDDDDFLFALNIGGDSAVSMSADITEDASVNTIEIDENSYDLGNMTEEDFTNLGSELADSLYY